VAFLICIATAVAGAGFLLSKRIPAFLVLALPRADEISSADMNQVAGGMSCEAGIAVAGVYLSVARVLGALGDSTGQANFAGKAEGLITGTCS
jgi:hypothetical protein